MINPRILTFSGSTRSGSVNARLAAAMARKLALSDAAVTQLSLIDYELPIYNGDLEGDRGIPENARKLSEQMASHHGVFIAAPEYNAGVTPLLKNTLDWVSRVHDESGRNAFVKPVFAIGAASPGAFAGVRGLIQLRQILCAGLGATVLSQEAMVPNAMAGFDDNEDPVDERARAMLAGAARALLDAAKYIMQKRGPER